VASTAVPPAVGVPDHPAPTGGRQVPGGVTAVVVSAGGGDRHRHRDVVVAAPAVRHGLLGVDVQPPGRPQSQRVLEAQDGLLDVRLAARPPPPTPALVAPSALAHRDVTDVPSSPARRRALQVAVFLQIILLADIQNKRPK